MSTSLTRILRVTLYVAAVGLGIDAVRLAAFPPKAQFGPESAFTVVLKEHVTNGSGRVREGSTQTRAVRSDGSTLLKLGADETGSRLILFSAGIEVMTNDRLRLKSTVKKSFSGSHLHPGTGCSDPHRSDEQSLPDETVAGYRAAQRRTVTESTGHDGALEHRTTTVWYALDHGCAMLKSRLDFGNGESDEWKLVTLIPGEPANSLYDVPADYREVPPSALGGPDEARCSGPNCEAKQKRDARRDAEYYANRPLIPFVPQVGR